MLATSVLALLLPLFAFASPLVYRFGNPSDSGPPTPVSAQEISANFVQPAYFSQIAYCLSDVIQAWDCDSSCQAKLHIDDFTLLTVGGGVSSLLNEGLVDLADNTYCKMERMSHSVGVWASIGVFDPSP